MAVWTFSARLLRLGLPPRMAERHGQQEANWKLTQKFAAGAKIAHLVTSDRDLAG
jgi:hypothetical protein